MSKDFSEFAVRPKGPIFSTLDTIARICLAIAGVQMAVLIGIFGWLVFGRYVLNDTPTWVEQAALLLVVWIVFLGGAVGVWRQTHLAVDFIRQMMPPVPRFILHVMAFLMLITFGAVMAWQGYDLAHKTWARRIPMLGVAEGWRAVPMSIFGVLCVIFTVDHLIQLLKRGIQREV